MQLSPSQEIVLLNFGQHNAGNCLMANRAWVIVKGYRIGLIAVAKTLLQSG